MGKLQMEELLGLKKQNEAERLIRLKELKKIVSYSATSIWRRCKDGTFPLPVRIGPAAVAWKMSEIEAWMSSRQSVSNTVEVK
jgi:prophage regulatory protein